MADLKGMTGKIARVDLSSGTVSVVEPPEEVYKKFLGGSALGLYYMFKEGIVEPDVDKTSDHRPVTAAFGVE